MPKSIPLNNKVLSNIEKYYDKILPEAQELNNNEIRRLFNRYDEKGLGFIDKEDIQYLFLDVKNQLMKKDIRLNEKVFINKMLSFWTNSSGVCSIDSVKKCLSEIIQSDKDIEPKNNKRLISPLKYLKTISNMEVRKKNEINDYLASNKRNDIYQIKSYGNRTLQPMVILNENKLQSIYK